MDINTIIVKVFTYIDDWLQDQNWKLRQRGPQPTMHDSEVLTIEIIGSFLGLSTDKGVFLHFQRHYGHYFPALCRINRTTYVRQSANLWKAKEYLWQDLLRHIDFDLAFSIVDSIHVPVCRFARANRCRRLREISAYGHDEVARQTFLGVRTHLHISIHQAELIRIIRIHLRSVAVVRPCPCPDTSRNSGKCWLLPAFSQTQ